ncbi:MAG TPA: TQO small subunit DoxD, partial [Solirubrobacteraceae bacterium]
MSVPPRNSARRGQVRGRRPGDGATGAESDARRLGWALFPVRLFLGVTFVYGGIQKLSDPGFLRPGAPTYIGTQLRGFANGTPGGFLLRAFAIPHARVSGVGVALIEIAVGLLVGSGLLTRPAAAVGLALNLLLFLTNSWHTYPYFLGSDIVFVFAWAPFVLVGATRQPTLEPVLNRIAAARMGRAGPAATGHP